MAVTTCCDETHGRVTPPRAYREVLQEYLVEHSAAKHARGPDGPIRVGALAPGSANPFDNVPAQLVEAVHALEEAARAVVKAKKVV